MPGRVTVETIDSVVLRGNPLADPHERRVPVWLPPTYDASPSRRYPVVYWLAGFTGDGRTLFNASPWQESLDQRLDRLAAAGVLGECVVVAPDCFTRYGGSQYLDSTATGRYETHLCGELVGEIDRRFRTIPERDARGIGGKSSGGFGAMVLGMRHPDLFAAVACHSGDAYFELSVLPEIPKVVRHLRRHRGVDGFLRHFDAAPKKSGDDVATIMKLAEAAAYAPDPSRPHGFALPFDLDTGELDEAVWRRWKAWDPAELARSASAAQALRGMKLVFVDAGMRDEWALDLGARILVARLRAQGVAVRHEEFDDGHMGIPYRYDVSLPLLAAALGARP